EETAAKEAVKVDEQAHKEDAKLQCIILKEQKAAQEASARRQEEDKAARAVKHQLDLEARTTKRLKEQQKKEEQAAARLQAQIERQINCSSPKWPSKHAITASNDPSKHILPSQMGNLMSMKISEPSSTVNLVSATSTASCSLNDPKL
ncbi:hypothetical protein AJ79_08833, partial [Helicocarpus griseus UAMH5409]